ELEHQPSARLPHEHAADLEALSALLVVDLHQPAAGARLEPHDAVPLGIEPVARVAPPPGPDLLREDVEGGARIDLDHGGDSDGVVRLHARVLRRLPRVRSAWALNAPSCSFQNAST